MPTPRDGLLTGVLRLAPLNSPASPATFLGLPIDNTSLFVSYTLHRDTDLDRMVTLNDFTRLAAAFGEASQWSGGDFDCDGSTTLADFT